jgi:hypothetical protein
LAATQVEKVAGKVPEESAAKTERSARAMMPRLAPL